MKRTAFLLLLAACNKSGNNPSPQPTVSAPQSINVTSGAFQNSAAIPNVHSCDGKDTIPALAWTAPPEGSGALVLIVDDPDAPGGVFTHLVAWNAKNDARALAAQKALDHR